MAVRYVVAASAVFTLSLTSGSAGASGEEPTPEQAQDCFRNEDIAGWGVIDASTVRVRINSRRMYALHTQTRASRVRFANEIAVTSRSGWICTGEEPGIELHVGGSTPRNWVIDRVERLAPPADSEREP
jgi:hypothetical protein